MSLLLHSRLGVRRWAFGVFFFLSLVLDLRAQVGNTAVSVHPPASLGAPQDIFQNINWPADKFRSENVVIRFGNAANKVPILDGSGLLPDSIVPNKGTAGTYGDATHTLTLTLDAKGRATGVSTNLITPAGIGAEVPLTFSAPLSRTTNTISILTTGWPSLAFGNTTSTSTATPLNLNLGGTYSSTAGANPKLILFDNGTDKYGTGVSSTQFDFMAPTGAGFVWYINGVEKMRLSSAGVLSGDGAGLSNVTKSAIVPNTAPSSGQVLVGNAGGTAYAPQTVSGSGATITLSSVGVITISAIPNATLSNSIITIAGTSTALGASITRDTITGVSSNGILARTGANALTNRTLTGTTNQVSISNGDGASGNPTFSTPQNIDTAATVRFGSLGLGTAAPSTSGLISAVAGANNVTIFTLKRNTDTSPTGNFSDFQNAAGTSLWTVDMTGSLAAGSIPNARLVNAGAITIAGNSIALGGSITLDTIDNGIAANGLIARTAANARAARTITGTANQISVSNGDGVSGNPALSISASAQLSIAKNTLLTTNGFVKTSGSDGTLSVANIVAGDVPATLNATAFSGTITANANLQLGDDRTSSAVKIGTFGHIIGRDSGTGSLWVGGGQNTIELKNPTNVSGNLGLGTNQITTTSRNQDVIQIAGDSNWTFGGYNSGSNYWTQTTYAENSAVVNFDNLRGFRVLDRYTGLSALTSNLNATNAGGGYTIGVTGSYSPSIVFIGDSLSQISSATLAFTKSITTTNGSSTITFAANALTSANVGHYITGTGIPNSDGNGNSWIGAILSSTSATISSDARYNIPANATASGTITATISPTGYNSYFGVATGTSPENFAVGALGTYEGLSLSPANGQNVAVAGKTIEQLYEMSYPLISKFRQESGMNIVVLLAGTNNLGLNSDSAALTYSKLAAFCTWLKSQPGSPRIIVVGLTSRGGSNANGTYDSQIATVNGYIRRSWAMFADRFIDWGAINSGSNEFAAGGYSNTTWYSGDQLHFTAAGMKKLATYVQPAINDLLTGYYQAQRNQLFVRLNKASHDNIASNGMLTLQNENPVAGQSEINFTFYNGSTYALKANIRTSYLGELALGATGSITEYIDATYGPDVYGNGTTFAQAVSYKTTTTIESLLPHRITSNGSASFTTGKGLELNYISSLDIATIGSFDHAGGGTWKPIAYSGSSHRFDVSATTRLLVDASGLAVTANAITLSGATDPSVTITNTGMSGSPGVNIGVNSGNNAILEQTTGTAKPFYFYNGHYALALATSGGATINGTTDAGAGNLMVGGQSAKAGAVLFGNDGSLYLSYVLLSSVNYYNFAAGAHVIADVYDVRSSRTYKKNIHDWAPRPDALDRFRARSFERLDYATDESEVGPIAEELKEIMPEAVGKDGKSVHPMALLTWALTELQKQKKEIEQLKHENHPDNRPGLWPNPLDPSRTDTRADNLADPVLRR